MGSFTGISTKDVYDAIQLGLGNEYNTIDGAGGDDELRGGYIGNLIFGGTGNDIIYGMGGGDDLYGGDGNDVINAGGGDDLISDGDGNDTLYGYSGDDIFDVGIAGQGLAATSTIDLGQGDDLVFAGGQIDKVTGGQGIDMIDYSRGLSTVVVNLQTGLGRGGWADKDSYRSIEDVRGSAYNDTIIGNGAYNTLNGYRGNDTISGGYGGDELDGGDGIDSLDYRASTSAVKIDLAAGTAAGGDAEGDSFYNFENIFGSAYYDQLYGDSKANTLRGYDSHDQLHGQDGNDTLAGGAGRDYLYGGSGADKFLIDTRIGVSSIDTIFDFVVSIDKMVLDNDVFTEFAAGEALSAAAFRANWSGAAADSDDRIIYEIDRGYLYYDADGTGSGKSICFAQLTTTPTITNADFIIVD